MAELFILVLVGTILVLPIIVLIPVFKTLAPMYGYSYTNARLRAMRNSLPKDEDIKNLASKNYLDILNTLEKTTHPQLREHVGPETSFSVVDRALREELIHTLAKVKRVSPAQSKKFVGAYLERYDVQVIKTIVRSQKIKGGLDRTLLNVTETFSQEFITRDSITIDDLYNELKGSAYEKVLRDHLEEIKQGKYYEFERDLDIFFHKRLLHYATNTQSRRFVKFMIDMQNVSLTLKGIESYLPGGRIPLSVLDPKDTPSQVAAKIKQYGYTSESSTPELIERDLQKQFKNLADQYLTQNPLSESTIVGFIIAKNVAARNITILLKLRSHDVEPAKVLEVLAI